MNQVSQFMDTCGQTEITRDLADQNLALFRLALIEEEVGELKAAIAAKDRTEVVDALADILYVVYGAAKTFDVDIDAAFAVVHASNMSKFCTSEAEAIETVEYYGSVMAETGYRQPKYRKQGDLYVVYNADTGKILKGIRYTPAYLRHL